jgi:hypothetical protein
MVKLLNRKESRDIKEISKRERYLTAKKAEVWQRSQRDVIRKRVN